MTSAPKFQKAEYTLDNFQTITDIISIPFILTVQKTAPYKTLKEFIAYAKANPGKISVGTPGVGSTPHLAMEIFAGQAGFTYTHVPYTGVATAIVGLMGGHVDAVFGAPSSISPQVKSGELIALGISAKERFKPHSDIPTFYEQGFQVEVVSSFGFFAPKATPVAIVEKLNAAFQEVAKDPAYVENMTKLYNDIKLLGPAEFRKALQDESAAFDPVIAKLPKP
jgi:tripartite-type tricarboxylate transporter receptor subunit TctC